MILADELQYLATSSNDQEVFFDPVDSHAASHFAGTPKLVELVKEVIRNAMLTEQKVEFDIDMGRIVGNTDGVRNKMGDEIVYAKRKNRDIYTPFNKTQSAQPCSKVSVSFYKVNPGKYALHSAWIGSFDSPPMPGDSNETSESKPYWSTHSLVWGSQEIQPGTETSICPW